MTSFYRRNRTVRRNADFKAERTSPVVGIAVLVGFIAVLVVIGTVMAKELVNTATNEIATPSDMGLRDILEDIFNELDQKGADSETIFIVEEYEDESVALFGVHGYIYEDYEDAGHEPVKLDSYDNVMELWEELN